MAGTGFWFGSSAELTAVGFPVCNSVQGPGCVCGRGWAWEGGGAVRVLESMFFTQKSKTTDSWGRRAGESHLMASLVCCLVAIWIFVLRSQVNGYWGAT